MNFFKEFSYRLLRAFALTTGFCTILLLYIGFQALHGNLLFFTMAAIMLIATVFFAYVSRYNYLHRPVSLKADSVIYDHICQKCGALLEQNTMICPQCGEKVQS